MQTKENIYRIPCKQNLYKIIISRNIKHDLKELFLREKEREIELPIPKADGGS